MDTMQIGAQIKRHRGELGLSQDGLAAKVYVSRQTISSWETGKTYPDVQSLLMLSELFGVTVDDLVKGDLETMNKAIDSDIILMKRLSIAILGFLLLMLACLIWLSVQMIAWDWTFAQTMPTALLALPCGASPCSSPSGRSGSRRTETSSPIGRSRTSWRAARSTAARSAGGGCA